MNASFPTVLPFFYTVSDFSLSFIVFGTSEHWLSLWISFSQAWVHRGKNERHLLVPMLLSLAVPLQTGAEGLQFSVAGRRTDEEEAPSAIDSRDSAPPLFPSGLPSALLTSISKQLPTVALIERYRTRARDRDRDAPPTPIPSLTMKYRSEDLVLPPNYSLGENSALFAPFPGYNLLRQEPVVFRSAMDGRADMCLRESEIRWSRDLLRQVFESAARRHEDFLEDEGKLH